MQRDVPDIAGTPKFFIDYNIAILYYTDQKYKRFGLRFQEKY